MKLAGDGQPIQYGDIGLGTGSTAMCHQEGQPMYSFWVYQQAYDADGKPIQGVVVDRDGNGVIDNADKYFYKSAAAPGSLASAHVCSTRTGTLASASVPAWVTICSTS